MEPARKTSLGTTLLSPLTPYKGTGHSFLAASPHLCILIPLLEITVYEQTPGLVFFLPLLTVTQYIIHRRTCPELIAGAGVLSGGHSPLRHEDKSAAILEKDQ